MCLLIVVLCSAALQPNITARKDNTDVLNADTNRRLSRTLDRVSDKQLASPLIIRHVAGSVTPEAKKSHLHQQPVASTVHRMDITSSADRHDDDGLANMKGDQDCGPKLKDHNKKTETKLVTDAETEVVDDEKDEVKVTHPAAGCDSAGVKFEKFAVMSECEISQGYTTNAADRALRVAPFTNASHAISLMCSEVVGGGGDSDEEAGDGNMLVTPAASSKSPLGSSSSAQMSGHRSVQHMLKQIQDAGERLNERISSRDFGARRRLPTVPVDAVNDSDMPTSSQSAKSDGSGGEAHAEHRPIRSVLEELPRPAIRSPRSIAKNPGSPSVKSRQLPDPSAVRHLAQTDQSTQKKPENLKLSDCSPDNETDLKCNRQLLDPSSTKHSILDDHLLNPALLIHDVDIATGEKHPMKLSDSLQNNVDSAGCEQLPDTVTKPKASMTSMQPDYVCDILTYSAEKNLGNLKLSSKLAESEADAESKEFPDLYAAKNSVAVDCQVTSMQSFHDPDVTAESVDLKIPESRPENFKWSDSTHCTAAVTKLVGRGMADGESPRNTISDEIAGKFAVSERLQSPTMKLSDLDCVPVCKQTSPVHCCNCAVVVTNSNTAKHISAGCFRTESAGQRIHTLSQCALDQMQHEYLSSSAAAGNQIDFITEDELKQDPNVCGDSLVKLETRQPQASVTSSDVAKLLWNKNQKGNEGHKVTVHRDQLTAISVPNASSPAMSDADTATNAKPIDTCSSLHSTFNSVTAHRDTLFLLHNDKHICNNEVIEENAEQRSHNNSSSLAEIASTSNKLKSGDNWLHTETDLNTDLCHKTSTSVAASPVATNELVELNMKSSNCVFTSANCVSCGVIDGDPFRFAGPKRALFSQSTSAVVSSSSAFIKTGSQPVTVLSTATNMSGNVPAKNDRLTDAHMPLIRSTHAADTTTVSSAADKHVSVNQRKPGNVAVNIGHTALSRVTAVHQPIRLSTRSPQPPTEPASSPAIAASQARFA